MTYHYRGRQCLITGGLGFIGSNLAIRLARDGARVTIVDLQVPGCGANSANIRPVADSVEVVVADIAKPEVFDSAIRRADVVFNLAAEISHSHSRDFPDRDLALNVMAQLKFLRYCARRNPGVRIVYASTRQLYGTPKFLPVHEEHPVQPVDFNGVHKKAAGEYHLILGRTGGIDPVIVRLTNVYGPRMAINAACQGFLASFLRRALLGQPIEIYGDGSQLRDPLHVDDAVDALLRAGACEHLPHRIYNVGGAEALTVEEIARIYSDFSAGSIIVKRPFPEGSKQLDIGSYYSDCTRIQDDLGWRATRLFEEGLSETFEFYRSQLCSYLDLDRLEQQCGFCSQIRGAAAVTEKRAAAS